MVRVSETRPGLSIPSRNTDRGIVRRRLTDFVHAVLCQLCAIDTENSINDCIVVVEGNILFSQEKTSAETQMPVLKEGLYIVQILCPRHPFGSYPAGLTIADLPG